MAGPAGRGSPGSPTAPPTRSPASPSRSVHPSRESVLAALPPRSCTKPLRPLRRPAREVRVDRGKDFLSRTVTAAFDLLDVTVEDLPAYTPTSREPWRA
ncbi:hypothetical protein NKH18_51605 [Streptomyces sp. M10(2022)]